MEPDAATVAHYTWAYQTQYPRYCSRVRRHYSRLTTTEVDDCVQNVFTDTWRRICHGLVLATARDVDNYLLRGCHHVVVDLIKSANYRFALTFDHDGSLTQARDEQDTPAEALDRRDAIEDRLQMVQRFAYYHPQSYAMLLLHHVMDLSCQDIIALMGEDIPISFVKSRMTRFRMAMREFIQRDTRGITPRQAAHIRRLASTGLAPRSIASTTSTTLVQVALVLEGFYDQERDAGQAPASPYRG